jgi:hypothetical protein
MSPVLRISDLTFKRLQKYATPLVDTVPTVIDKLLDFCDSRGLEQLVPQKDRSPKSELEPAYTLSSPIESDPSDPHSLSHTRVLTAEFDRQPADGWNNLVRIAHKRAIEHFRSFESLRSATPSHIVKGRRDIDGFHYVPEIDISIQNVDANVAWRNSLALARKLGCPLRVEFEWRNKKGAAFPGQSGVLSWKAGLK